MGFSSWLSAKSGVSIPAYPYSKRHKILSHVVLILPDDSTVTGYYDGYGMIHPEENFTAYVDEENRDKFYEDQDKAVDIWEVVKPFMRNPEDWKEYQKLIKLVRVSEYKGEKFNDLPPSKMCPWQGYFYSGEESL